MAITTDSYYDVIYNEETVDRIGLSKTLDNYTIEEIAAMTYCGTEFSMVKNISQRQQGVNLVTWDLAKPFVAEDGEHIGNGGKYILSPGNSDYQFPNGMPFNVVWIAFETSYAPPQQLNDYEGMAAHCKIITEFDAPKYVFEMQQPVQRGGIGATSWNTADAPLYDTGLYLHDNNGNILKYQISDNEFTGALNPAGGCVAPYMFATLNGYTVLVLLCSYNNQWYNRGNGTDSPWVPDGEWTGGGPYINYNWETSFGSSCNVASLCKNSFNGEAVEFPYTWYYSEGYGSEDWGTELDCFGYNDLSEPIEVHFRGEPDDGMGGQRGFTLRTYCKDRDQIYKLIAGGGIRFKTDKIYKPIIESGWVTGYTDDMTTPSELDEWHGSTVHTVTPTPPVPPPSPEDDSDWDDIPINGAGIGGGSAFCRFYYCTEAELANLRTWTMGLSQSGDPIPGGFDPKSNIIGLTVYPFTVSGNGPTTIKFTTNGGQDPVTQQPMPRVVDSGVACEGGAGATVRILNATIDVPAAMRNRGEPWLDYESYIELYIPMCGIYQVDPQVCIGRTIHVEIFLDPVSGTVMGLAWVAKDGGKCIIAQGSGTPGVQIPVAVGNYGLAQAARVQNTLAGFGNTATSAISTQMVSNTFQNRAGERGLNGVRKISQNFTASSRIAAFNRSGDAGAALGLSGLVSSVQHWVSARQIANSPGTSASGGFSGSMAEWCGVFTPYVKVVRPKFRKPTNYKHTCGEPEVTTRKLNSVGYAVCINPDVSGLTNATEAERAAVYQYLSTGVYYK